MANIILHKLSIVLKLLLRAGPSVNVVHCTIALTRAVARSENLEGHVVFGGDIVPPGPPDCDRPANKSTVYSIIEVPYIHE